MDSLNKDWITEGLIDFEYKKYVLLAYLNHVRTEFNVIKLYPHLSDLIFHYQNLVSLRDHKKMMADLFPKEISKADFEKLTFEYKKMVEDNDLMQQLEGIILFAIPELKKILTEGKDVYEYIEENLEIEPVGIQSLYSDEGYVFLNEDSRRETRIYEYQITIFENAREKFRGIHLEYIDTIRKSIGETFENIKIQLIKSRKKLPNPATFLINAKIACPYQETLLPVAKRVLIKHIYKAAA